jgi:hypothetical protein
MTPRSPTSARMAPLRVTHSSRPWWTSCWVKLWWQLIRRVSVPDIEDLRAWKRRFEDHGVDHSEIKKTGTGAAMITFRDPDNIQIELFATQ